jgi:hypothetical protein
MLLSGKYNIQTSGNDSTEEVAIVFIGGWQILRRNTLSFRDNVLESNEIDWIWNRGKDWYVNFECMSNCQMVTVQPTSEKRTILDKKHQNSTSNYVHFTVTKRCFKPSNGLKCLFSGPAERLRQMLTGRQKVGRTLR